MLASTAPPPNVKASLTHSSADQSSPNEKAIVYDAVILAGGAGSRLGGIDKAALELNGSPLLQRALAASLRARRRVVVGVTSVVLPEDVISTVETPARSGPAAALCHGVKTLASAGASSAGTVGSAAWTLVLACDLPGAVAAVQRLERAVAAARDARTDIEDAFVLTDDAGHLQWVCGLYQTESLQAQMRGLGDPRDLPLRRLVSTLSVRAVEAPMREWQDIDTWQDIDAWQDPGMWQRRYEPDLRRGALPSEGEPSTPGIRPQENQTRRVQTRGTRNT